MINYLIRLRFITIFLGLMLGLATPKETSALTWQTPPEEFTPTPLGSTFFNLAADPNGNAFTMWVDNNQLLVSRFSAITESYGAPDVIYTGNPSFVFDIDTDATETAIAVWFDRVTGLLLSSHFNGVSWSPILPAIATVPLFPFSVSISLAMDGLGNGLLTWQDQSVVPLIKI